MLTFMNAITASLCTLCKSQILNGERLIYIRQYCQKLDGFSSIGESLMDFHQLTKVFRCNGESSVDSRQLAKV